MEKDRIYGIHCNVDKCVYNSNNCECTAGKINVGCTCTDPNCCDETECKTFMAFEKGYITRDEIALCAKRILTMILRMD